MSCKALQTGHFRRFSGGDFFGWRERTKVATFSGKKSPLFEAILTSKMWTPLKQISQHYSFEKTAPEMYLVSSSRFPRAMFPHHFPAI